MSKTVGVVVVLLIIIGLVYGTYNYFTGYDYELYYEASALYESGKIRQAHDKAIKALKVRPLNRKALSLKSKLYGLIHNEDLLNEAKASYVVALGAVDRAEYTLAIDKIEHALEKLGQISPSSSVYNEALVFQTTVSSTVEKIVDEAPKMYLNKAKVEIAKGELERAYNTLTYIVKPDKETAALKDDIVFTLASNEYNDILNKKNDAVFFIRDAIFWFDKVSEKSPNYKQAQQYSAYLKNLLKAKE